MNVPARHRYSSADKPPARIHEGNTFRMRAGGRKSGSAKQSSLRLRASCATNCAEKTCNCADADENAAQACNDLLEVAESCEVRLAAASGECHV